jgi:hypothetical protein
MSNIKIGRYAHESITHEWSGWIEPDDGSWIIFTDADGKPALYFPERESSGAVIGEGIPMQMAAFEYALVETVG